MRDSLGRSRKSVKLKYLSNSADGPVLLFERADTRSVRALRTALEPLASGHAPAVELHRVPGIEAVDGCQLVALLSDAPGDPLLGGGFAWRLKPLQWESVLGLLEPMVARRNDHRCWTGFAKVLVTIGIGIRYGGHWLEETQHGLPLERLETPRESTS